MKFVKFLIASLAISWSLQMIKSKKDRFFTSLITLLFFACSFQHFIPSRDLYHKDVQNDLKTTVTSSDVYLSKRGFGNDRFDIVTFQLKDSKASDEIDIFKIKDGMLDDRYRYWINTIDNIIIDENDGKNTAKDIIRQLEIIYDSKEVYYAEDKSIYGTDRFYLYSKDLNMGYYIVLVI